MARTKKLENVASGGWPKINQGTHLIVKTFEDGSTELIWDDAQLLKEVQDAIASVTTSESTAVKSKRTKKAKA
jgi:type IV secretory pathway VirD2 relaxase